MNTGSRSSSWQMTSHISILASRMASGNTLFSRSSRKRAINSSCFLTERIRMGSVTVCLRSAEPCVWRGRIFSLCASGERQVCLYRKDAKLDLRCIPHLCTIHCYRRISGIDPGFEDNFLSGAISICDALEEKICGRLAHLISGLFYN